MIFATTFTTPWLWKKNILLLLLLRSLHYDYGKKNKSIFIPTLLSLHIYLDDKILFCYCCYVHYAMIITKNKLIFISVLISLHNFHKTKVKKVSYFSLSTFSVSKRFVHYTVVSYLGISEYFLLRKFSVFKRFVYETVVSPSGVSVESYMLYYP